MTQQMPSRNAVHAATVLFDLADRAQSDANALRRYGTRALTGNYHLGRMVGAMRTYANRERYGFEVVAEILDFTEQPMPENIRKRNAKGRERNKERHERYARRQEELGRAGADVLSIRDFR